MLFIRLRTGSKAFIVVMKMFQHMFGSVDDIDEISGWLDELGADYRIHVDAAFGGYISSVFHH